MEESPKHFRQNPVEFENEIEQNQLSEVVDVIEQNDQDNAFINRNHTDDNLMGKVVNNEEETFNLYNEYAIRKGFSVRRSKKRFVIGKSNTQQLRTREYRCSKAGSMSETSFSSKVFRNKLVARSDCKAMIRFTIENGLWTVTHFVIEHNHELASPAKTYLLRSNRSIIAPKANLISSMVNAGLRTKDVFAFMSGEVGISFGVVLLEMLTGRRPIERGRYIAREVKMVIDRTKDSYNLRELLDPAGIGLETSLKGMNRFVDLELKCVQESGSDRPTMGEVVKEIENILQLAGLNPNADSATTSASYEDASKGSPRHPYSKDSFEYSTSFPPSKIEPL